MDPWYSQAAGLYNGGRVDLAEQVVDKALAAGHESPALRTLRCRCLTVRQRFREAEADACRALELDPTYAEAFNALSWCHFQGRRIEKAAQAIEEALRLNPNESRHHYVRGLIRNARGQGAEALTCLEEALRLNPDNTAAAGFRAQILMARGHTERAMEAARAALSRNPDDPKLLKTLAWAHLDQRDPKQAEEAFRAALRRDPTNFSAQEGLRNATERLYSWKIGAGIAATSAFMAAVGATGILPDAPLVALASGVVGTIASFLGLGRRERLRAAVGCVLGVFGILSLFLFFALAVVISKLQDAPPGQWRNASFAAAGAAAVSAAFAATVEIRGRRIPGR